MKKLINKLFEIIDSGTKIIICVFLSLMIINIAVNVFCRYVLLIGISWSEEIARYLMVWLAFLGMSLAVKSNGHINVVFFTNILPPKVQVFLKYLVNGIVLSLLIMILIQSIYHLDTVSDQTSIASQLPMYIPYASVTFGAFLMILQLLRRIGSMIQKDIRQQEN